MRSSSRNCLPEGYLKQHINAVKRMSYPKYVAIAGILTAYWFAGLLQPISFYGELFRRRLFMRFVWTYGSLLFRFVPKRNGLCAIVVFSKGKSASTSACTAFKLQSFFVLHMHKFIDLSREPARYELKKGRADLRDVCAKLFLQHVILRSSAILKVFVAMDRPFEERLPSHVYYSIRKRGGEHWFEDEAALLEWVADCWIIMQRLDRWFEQDFCRISGIDYTVFPKNAPLLVQPDRIVVRGDIKSGFDRLFGRIVGEPLLQVPHSKAAPADNQEYRTIKRLCHGFTADDARKHARSLVPQLQL